MVKNVFLLFFVCICIQKPLGQNKTINDAIDLSFTVSKDTVCFGDSLELCLSFINKTEKNIVFLPHAIIQMYTKMKITDTLNIFSDRCIRDNYVLNASVKNDIVITLKPGNLYNINYKMKVTDDHFFPEENEIQIFYYFKASKRVSRKTGALQGLMRSPFDRIFVKFKLLN